MSSAGERSSYVDRVREDMHQLVQELREEVTKARAHLVVLESENGTLQDKLRIAKQRESEARDDLAREQERHQLLERRLLDIEKESLEYSERFSLIERQNQDLANLYVACYGLHGTLIRAEVIQTIQEIVINLIGCEEFGIFELSSNRTELVRIAEMGLGPDHPEKIALEKGLIAKTVRQGASLLLDSSEEAVDRLPEEKDLSASIPLLLDGMVEGAVILYRLLPQKNEGLVPVDREILELLASQAASALHASRLASSARCPSKDSA